MKKLNLLIVFIIIFNMCQAQLKFTDLVKQTEKSVVTIITMDKFGNPLLRGTGFLILDRGVILSNYHIFEGAFNAKIITYDNVEHDLDSIVSSSREYDIIKFTIVNFNSTKFTPLPFCNKKPQKGEDIFTIGNPLGLESTVSKGIISSIREIYKLGNIYQITAPISSGSSGSPVLNMNGEVFGIATFQINGGQNLNFALDIGLAEKINSNDAILTSIAVKKSLPADKQEALNLIDSIWVPDEKLQYVNEFIKKYPNDYNGYLLRARNFCESISSASLFLDLEIKLNSDSLLTLSEFSATMADKDFQKAILLNPSEPIIYYYRGIAKYRYCKENMNKTQGWTFQSAIDDLLKSNGLKDPKDMQDRYYYLGQAYLELSQFKSALNAFNKAVMVKDVPTDSTDNPHRLYYEIAKIKCNQLKDTVGAINDLNRAIELTRSISTYQGEDQAPSEYLAKRAEIEYAQKKYAEALEDLNKVNKSIFLSDDGRRSYTHYFESFLILQLDGDLDAALESINIAINWDDYVDFFYKTRANVYKRLKEYANALKDINKAFELNPNGFNDWDYSERSRVKGLLNDYIGAIKDIDEALKRNSKESYYYNLKAIYLRQLGDDIGAEKQYDKAIELDPKNTDYYISRGWTRLKNKKTDACADWSKAGELGNYEAYDLIQKYCK